MPARVLLSDISNGSYLKLALAEPGHRHESTANYACADLAEFGHVIKSFLADNGDPPLRGAAFSTSGWEVDGHVDLVHFGFHLKRSDIKSLLNIQRLNLVNDCVARALAVPLLKPEERIKVCGGDEVPDQVTAVLGLTAGFGVALLAPDGMGGWTASHCEGGHSDFVATNDLEIEILKVLIARFGHASRERAVSIPGIAELWRSLSVVEGADREAKGSEEVLALASSGDEVALRVIKLQTQLMASAASDIALIMGARGGIYIGGPMMDLIGDLFDYDVFAARFYDKGRVSSYVRDIPVYKMAAQEAELIGLSTLFE